jgi:hypothetical protein
MLTQSRLKELLDYQPLTGLFYWRNGKVAGWDDASGYIQISVNGRQYRAHRLAWLYMTGAWPNGLIDHRDTNRSNNRWDNLRPATHSQNHANAPLRSDNSSGFKGVCLHKKTGKYKAAIQVNRKSIYLGLFPTPELAHDAYVSAATKYFGDYARLN